MEHSEPWQSLGTGYSALFDLMRHPARERYVATLDHRIAGFVTNKRAPGTSDDHCIEGR